jgi:formate dehydrogenase assembly factor FdhD
MKDKILEAVEYALVNGGCTPASERIVKETALTININGKHYATAMILADKEKEFVTGHLFTQGIIQKTDDVKSFTIKNNTAEVTLANINHALDKVIGAALLQGVPLNETVIASTGRMTSEMVGKICRAGIPIIATKAAVTDRGVELAKEHGVTLIGFVRDAGTTMQTDMSARVFKKAGMKIYTGADRVRCD